MPGKSQNFGTLEQRRATISQLYGLGPKGRGWGQGPRELAHRARLSRTQAGGGAPTFRRAWLPRRGFAEWGEVFGDPVVATALLDRLLHHAVVFQIEGASYRLRQHADLVPEHIRAKANLRPLPIPATMKRRGRPPKNGDANQTNG